MTRGLQRAPMNGPGMVIQWVLATSLSVAIAAGGPAASTTAADDWQTPQTRLRPIGSPSAVDAFRASQPPGIAGTIQTSPGTGSAVRQAVMMQTASGPFAMPPSGLPQGDFASPPSSSLPVPLTSSPSSGPIPPSPAQFDPTPLPRPGTAPVATPAPLQTYVSPSPGPTAVPGGMTPVPRSGAPATAGPSGGDYAPLAQPRLDIQFATLSNCRNISAPSGYRSDRILTCGQPAGYITTIGASAPPPTYLPPAAQLGPPVMMAPTAPASMPFGTSQPVIPGPSGYRPLISFGQERYPVQIGQGIFGQPTAYVPGQTFRNAIRYITW